MDPSVIEGQFKYGEDYFKRHFPEIKRDEYPNAPDTFWTDPQRYIKEHKVIKLKSNTSHHRKQHLRVNLVLAIPDRPKITAMGDGATKVWEYEHLLAERVIM